MQITFDTRHDTPEDFKRAADWLASLALPGAVVVASQAARNHVHVTATAPDASTAAPETPPPFAPAPAAEVFAGNAAAPATAPTPAVPPVSLQSPATSAATAGLNLPPAVSAGGVELDSTGLPWDARIHSLGANNTHPKAANGQWKAKRGVDKLTTVKTVEAELRAIMAIGGPVAATPPPASVVPPAPPVPPTAAVAPPVPPAATTVAPPAPPAAAGACTTMPQLMTKITDAMGAAKLTQAQVLEAVKSTGLTELPQLAHRPDLIPGVAQYLDAVILMAP